MRRNSLVNTVNAKKHLGSVFIRKSKMTRGSDGRAACSLKPHFYHTGVQPILGGFKTCSPLSSALERTLFSEADQHICLIPSQSLEGWQQHLSSRQSTACLPAPLSLCGSGKAGNRQPPPPAPRMRSPAPSHSAGLLSYNSVVLPTACSAPAHRAAQGHVVSFRHSPPLISGSQSPLCASAKSSVPSQMQLIASYPSPAFNINLTHKPLSTRPRNTSPSSYWTGVTEYHL